MKGKEEKKEFFKDFENDFAEMKCKPLPKRANNKGGFARYFMANGNKYNIRSAAQGVPIKRWTAYEKLSLMFGYNATILKLYQNMQKTKQMINQILLQRDNATISIVDVLQHQDSILQGLLDFSNQRVNKALYLCTVFIVRAGEDLHQWDKEVAEEKISDWIAEGYDTADFFFLARIFSPDWNKIITGETESL